LLSPLEPLSPLPLGATYEDDPHEYDPELHDEEDELDAVCSPW